MDNSEDLVPLYESRLKRWVSFADQYSSVSENLTKRIQFISEVTETKTLELSHQFQLMATSAIEQSIQMKKIIELSHTVNINGEVIEIHEISGLLQYLSLIHISEPTRPY